VITKEEIIQILRFAPLRERAIIATMASSGLRVRAALNLQLANFRDNIWDESLPCYAIEIPEGLSKEGEPYITFCSYEAASYIRDLLKLRESRGETVKPSSHLFTAQDSAEQLSVSRFENLWRELCGEAGQMETLGSGAEGLPEGRFLSIPEDRCRHRDLAAGCR